MIEQKTVIDSELWVIDRVEELNQYDANKDPIPFPITYPRTLIPDAIIKFYLLDYHKIWIIVDKKEVKRVIPLTIFERFINLFL